MLSPLRRSRRDAAAAERPVTYFTYGGAWKQAIARAFVDPFTKKTGIPVQYQEPYTFAKLRAMHEAKAQQIDIVGVNGMDVYIAARLQDDHARSTGAWSTNRRSIRSSCTMRT